MVSVSLDETDADNWVNPVGVALCPFPEQFIRPGVECWRELAGFVAFDSHPFVDLVVAVALRKADAPDATAQRKPKPVTKENSSTRT